MHLLERTLRDAVEGIDGICADTADREVGQAVLRLDAATHNILQLPESDPDRERLVKLAIAAHAQDAADGVIAKHLVDDLMASAFAEIARAHWPERLERLV